MLEYLIEPFPLPMCPLVEGDNAITAPIMLVCICMILSAIMIPLKVPVLRFYIVASPAVFLTTSTPDPLTLAPFQVPPAGSSTYVTPLKGYEREDGFVTY